MTNRCVCQQKNTVSHIIVNKALKGVLIANNNEFYPYCPQVTIMTAVSVVPASCGQGLIISEPRVACVCIQSQIINTFFIFDVKVS